MKKNNPLVSIIIIFEEWNKYPEESLPYYSKLKYNNFEIFAFSTKSVPKSIQAKYPKIKFIASPNLKRMPAKRRDLAMKYAKGEFYAFIDDDAFPSFAWLDHAVKHFQNEKIAAVCGPGLTPETATLCEKSSGWISASMFGGFGTSLRFLPQKKQYIDDFPSMNLIVRSKDFKKVGGFDSSYYPGEDTKLCLDLTKKLNKKIIYDPDVLVYHHKRPVFKKHLIQNGRYGLHRGHFARILPETSRRFFYFIPSMFSAGVIGGLFLVIFNQVAPLPFTLLLEDIFLAVMGLYFILSFISALWALSKSKNAIIALLYIPGVFLTHFWYGLRFIQGYFSKDMSDQYGRTEG